MVIKDKIVKFYIGIVIFTLLLLNSALAFAIDVSGNIVSNTTWVKTNNPYVITGSIQVYPDTTLTVGPGVEVRFSADTSLVIGGELVAAGTEADPIKFTSNLTTPAKGDWGLISFISSAVPSSISNEGDYLDGSIIQNCTVEFGKGIVSNIGLYIANSTIQNNAGPGIKTNGGSLIINNQISLNRNAITLSGGGNANILSNSIENNSGSYGGAIWLDMWASGEILIQNNLIRNNQASNGAGIFLGSEFNSSTVIIRKNIIDGNIASDRAGGIFGGWESTDIIEDNDITNNVAGGWGGGIYSPNATVRYNRISHNTAGLGGGISMTGGSVVSNSITENTCDLGSAIHIWKGELSGNNIQNNNGTFVLYKWADNDIEVPNNYWGTANTAEVSTLIFDFYDDMTIGKVLYEPIAGQPFDFSGGNISGIVSNSVTGAPITGAVVSCIAGADITDENGTYNISNITPGKYKLEVTANGFETATYEDINVSFGESIVIHISMEPGNIPPSAECGSDKIVFNGLLLDGSQSTDSDGTITTYEWQLIHRENPDFNRTVIGVTLVLTDLKPGFYDIILTVVDDDGAVDIDEMVCAAIGLKGDLDLDGDVDSFDLSCFAGLYGIQ